MTFVNIFLNEYNEDIVKSYIQFTTVLKQHKRFLVKQVGQIEYQIRPLVADEIIEEKKPVKSFNRRLFDRYLAIYRPQYLDKADELYEKTNVSRAICSIEEKSRFMFPFLLLIFQNVLQKKLNSKHGAQEIVQRANEMIFKNNKQFQCIHLQQNLNGIVINDKFKLFIAESLDEKHDFLEKIEANNIYCTSEKSIFTNRDEFINNFIRLFYYEYKKELFIKKTDLLTLFLFVMGCISWEYNGMIHKQSLTSKHENNPIISFTLGGSILTFQSFAAKNQNTVYDFDGPTVNKLLHKNIECFGYYNEWIIEM